MEALEISHILFHGSIAVCTCIIHVHVHVIET